MTWRNGFRVFYMRKRGEEWNDPEQRQKRIFCGHGNESFDSIEMWNALKTWATWKCLKKKTECQIQKQNCAYIFRKQ